MTLEEFEIILKKIKDYTNYIYLHIKGEPLIHSKFKNILDLCKKYNMKVNITTNGVYLKERIKTIIESGIVRQINISLHSENNKANYIEDILESVSNIDNIIINYRFWTLTNNKLDTKMQAIINKIFKHYRIKKNTNKINNNTFISKADKFEWPNLNNNYYNEFGYCYGLKNQLGILSDGTIIICCLDSQGISNLGNIFTSDLNKILNSNIVKNIIKGFNNRCVYLELCKHCSYKEKFDK